MKKILLTLITALTLLVIPAEALASTLVLSPSSGTVNPGCTLSVRILLDTQGASTDGTDALLFYDRTRFSVTSSAIINGNVYTDYPGNVVDTTNGKITISGLASVSTPFRGQGTFATINFQTLSSAPAGAAIIRFDFDPNDKAKTIDSNVVERGTVVDTLNAVTDGNFTVGSGSGGCAVTPGSSPAPQGQSVPNQSQTGQQVVGYDENGNPIYASGSGTTKPISTLPNSALTGPTLVLAVIGVTLTVVGIIGLALL